MSRNDFILPTDHRPYWLEYPAAFLRIVDQMLVDVRPWHIMECERVQLQYKGLAERYPSRDLFPFAYRQDNDDVACWAKGTGEKVFIIHDFASSGYENEGAFDSIWAWFRVAIEETIEWD